MPSKTLQKHRSRFAALAARLTRVRSTVTAFKLAASADADDHPTIYWADLMRSLESMLPAAEDVEDFASSVLDELKSATDHSQPAKTSSKGAANAS